MSLDPLSKAIERAAKDRGRTHPQSPVVQKQNGEQHQLAPNSQTPQSHSIRVIPPSPEAWGNLRPGRNPKGRAAQTSFEVLTARVTQWLTKKNQNALIVTSPNNDNGKTNTAVNLALSIAASSDKGVLLIDLDLHNPSIHKAFGYKIEYGIADLLSGKKKFEDIEIDPGISGVAIIPGGSHTTVSHGMLTSSRIKEFAQEIKLRYPERTVIFDMPPILGSADVLSLIPLVQNYLLVVEAGKTTRKQLSNCVHILDQGHLIGTVLNRSQEYENAYT